MERVWRCGAWENKQARHLPRPPVHGFLDIWFKGRIAKTGYSRFRRFRGDGAAWDEYGYIWFRGRIDGLLPLPRLLGISCKAGEGNCVPKRFCIYSCGSRTLTPGGKRQVQRHASSALRLACDAEFLSETTVCRLIAPRAGGGGADRYTSAIETEFTGLEGLLWGASEVVPLVQGLTEAHLSIDDLIVVVKSSSLDSRATLVEELSAISSEAKDASRNLQKLFAQVQGAVDVYV
ncbi:hypothetical protein BU15DRAFT_68060 [Melanogaster broomeanus]|nr:hypothetical protein BU15DRAFT_68060 [Melanogaster broomeanus]